MPADANHARAAAVRVVQRLQEAGFVAYLAGGCVRDTLLGRAPKDYDVATDAEPPRVQALFRGARLVGEAVGVLLVPVREARQRFMIEVATFRTEWGYSDGRRPDGVRFSDARHDAQRRDFTINGLFEDPLAEPDTDPIIDYVHGREDLRRGVIRAIGDPEQRFGEDYLRMLRAVRFAARCRFDLDAATRDAILRRAGHLGQISAERIGQETRAMLTPGDDARPAAAIRLIQGLRLDDAVLGEDHADPPIPTVEALPGAVAYPTVLAAWLLDRRRADQGDDWCRQLDPDRAAAPLRDRLCLSNEQLAGLVGSLELLRRATTWSTLPTAGRKRLMAHPVWPEVLRLVDAHLDRVDGDLRVRILTDVKALAASDVAPAPFLRGDDLIALGLRPGPALGRLLEAVYDAQLEAEVTSRDQALAWIRRQL